MSLEEVENVALYIISSDANCCFWSGSNETLDFSYKSDVLGYCSPTPPRLAWQSNPWSQGKFHPMYQLKIPQFAILIPVTWCFGSVMLSSVGLKSCTGVSPCFLECIVADLASRISWTKKTLCTNITSCRILNVLFNFADNATSAPGGRVMGLERRLKWGKKPSFTPLIGYSLPLKT
jgi:hypothetical protein